MTNISLNLTRKENIVVSIYDIKGKLVKSIFKGYLRPGNHSFTWEERIPMVIT